MTLTYFKNIRIIAVFIIAVILVPSLTCASWNIVYVDAPRNFTEFSSRAVAIDSSGNPHVVYGRDSLYYAYYNGSIWLHNTIDFSPGVKEYSTIAIDSSDKVHISYYDSTNDDLKYATTTEKTDLIVDFGSGIWTRYSDITWTLLHSLDPETIATGDMDGSDRDEVIIDFGAGAGIWVRYNDVSWTNLHSLSPEIIAAGG